MGQKPSRVLSKNVKAVKAVESVEAVTKPIVEPITSTEPMIAIKIPMLEKVALPQHSQTNLSLEILKNKKTGGIPIEKITKTLRDFQVDGNLPSHDFKILAKYCRPPVLEKEREDGTSLGHWVDDLHAFSFQNRL